MAMTKKKLYAWNLDGTLFGQWDSCVEGCSALGMKSQFGIPTYIKKRTAYKNKYILSYDGVFPGLKEAKKIGRPKSRVPVKLGRYRVGVELWTKEGKLVSQFASVADMNEFLGIERSRVVRYGTVIAGKYIARRKE